MSKKKVTIIICLILVITALHYFTRASRASLHILYRDLYFIPIILAGLWAGRKIGLITSLSVTLLYFPHVLLLARPQMVFQDHHMMGMVVNAVNTFWGNMLQILIFNIAGFISGAYSDLKRNYVKTMDQTYQPITFQKGFLLCVDETPASLYAAKYLSDIFGNSSDVGVSVIWVSHGINPDHSESVEEISDRGKETHQEGRNPLNQVKGILVQGGIDESRIRLKTVSAKKNKKISEKILEHLNEGDYDTIVVGKHNLTKKQEFVFGSVAINLARQAPINVLIVKTPADAETEGPSVGT